VWSKGVEREAVWLSGAVTSYSWAAEALEGIGGSKKERHKSRVCSRRRVRSNQSFAESRADKSGKNGMILTVQNRCDTMM